MFFPMFVDLSGKEILVVGAGKIAARRIRTLCDFTERITVVAPEAAPEIAELTKTRKIVLLKRPFSAHDLDGKSLVLAATDDAALNREIARKCRERGIPVNVSSDQSLCDFQFPSIVQDGDVVIGVNASGRAHGLVKETRQKIEGCLGIRESSKYREKQSL